jgi:hypothetical protein
MRLLLTVADRRQRSQLIKALRSAGIGETVTSGEGIWVTGTAGSEAAK